MYWHPHIFFFSDPSFLGEITRLSGLSVPRTSVFWTQTIVGLLGEVYSTFKMPSSHKDCAFPTHFYLYLADFLASLSPRSPTTDLWIFFFQRLHPLSLFQCFNCPHQAQCHPTSPQCISSGSRTVRSLIFELVQRTLWRTNGRLTL
jgi:hypothetical protein